MKKFLRIKEIKEISVKSLRYDIEVENNHNFFANGILVHNCQNFPDILDRYRGETFYVSSKLDGTSATFYKKDSVIGCCSRNLEFKAEGQNKYWEFVELLNMKEKLPDNFSIQGELVGEGIQKNPLKIKGHQLYIFNVFDITNQKFLDYKDFVDFVVTRDWKTVPIINDAFVLNHTLEQLLELSQAKSPLNNSVDQEGIVIRPLQEQTVEMAGQTSARFSFKVISNKYLLKHEQE